MCSMKAANDLVDQEESYDGYFIGTVGSGKTKDELVQIKIPNLFNTSEESPFVPTIRYSPFGNGKGFGWFGTPQPTSKIVVTFQEGNVNYPLAHGFLSSKADFVGKVREYFNSDKKWGFVDPSGMVLCVDIENKTLYFEDANGVKIDMKAGNCDIEVPDNITVKAGGNARINCNNAIISAKTIRLN